jgi:hypothetical protein
VVAGTEVVVDGTPAVPATGDALEGIPVVVVDEVLVVDAVGAD